MKQQFHTLAEGQVFVKDGIELKKIQNVKVSCCRSINAEQVADANNKIFITPGEEVEVNDQLQ